MSSRDDFPTTQVQTAAPGVDPSLFFSQDFALPPLPAVVGSLLELLESGQATAINVSRLLASDVSLVAQLLKLVNSAYYGLPREIRDVKHAVAYLGLGEIRRVVLTVSVMENLQPEHRVDFQRFWYHSFHTALTAKRLARTHGHAMDTEELHVAALLHDVGKLVYMNFFPEPYAELLDYTQSKSVMLVDAEEHFGLPSHALLGATLSDRWRLPESVKLACRSHELKNLHSFNVDGGGSDTARMVAIANLLSNLATEELNADLKSSIRDEVLAALQCDEDAFLLLMAELYELRQEVQQFLRGL